MMHLVASLALAASLTTGTVNAAPKTMSRECKLAGQAAFKNYFQCRNEFHSGPPLLGNPDTWAVDYDSSEFIKNRIWDYNYQTTWHYTCDEPRLVECLKELYTELLELRDIVDCPWQVFFPFEIDTTDLKKNPFEAQANAHLANEEPECEWGVRNEEEESCDHLMVEFGLTVQSDEYVEQVQSGEVEFRFDPKKGLERYCKWFADLGCCGPSAIAYKETCVYDLQEDERDYLEGFKKSIQEHCPGIDWSKKSHCKPQAPFVSGGDICKDYGFRIFQLAEVDRAKKGESLMKVAPPSESKLDDASPAFRASAAILLSVTAVVVSLAAL